MKKVAVGSENPIKVAAVKKVCQKIWPQVKIINLEVSSGVRIQPLSDEEAIQGAQNRARRVLKTTHADLGFGLEGNVTQMSVGMFVTGWAAVIDPRGRCGLGSSGRLLLPKKIAQEIKNGGELGPILDQFLGSNNLKQKTGAAGIFTGNLITRQLAFETAIIFSLAPFLKPRFYHDTMKP